LWCTALEVAAEAGEAMNAAAGRTKPSRANRELREEVTGNSEAAGVAGKGS